MLLIFLYMFIISLFSISPAIAETLFIRGDANFDGRVDLSDSIFLNNYLFKGGSSPGCNDAADVNDDGKVDISDGIYLNNYLFLGTGSPPPEPYPGAGVDPTIDELGCGVEVKEISVSKCGGTSFEGNCKRESNEINEGPGGDFCTYSSFEECCDYKTKSTAIAYGGILDAGKEVARGIDTCKDSEILKEFYLNCPILTTSSDSVDYVEKDCNDYNFDDTKTYECTNGQVIEVIPHFDYGCSDGACSFDRVIEVKKIISRQGDSDYCYQKKNKCNQGCSQGEYDCDTNSECATGLVCLGPIGGASDGCCKEGQTWDTVNFRCNDCTTGTCCDVNGGKFKSSSTICNSNTGVVQYSCKEGVCAGNDVWKRVEQQFCSGTSSSCNGRKDFADSVVATNCGGSQYCSGSSQWVTTQLSCKNVQCTSGVCCDTSCGNYAFKGNDLICDPKSDEGCPWGTDLGSDTGKRLGGIVCSGTASTCGDGPLRWKDWFVKQDCSNVQVCETTGGSASCRNICFKNSDCGTDEWLDQRFCKNNDVWDKRKNWVCIDGGTKSSSCDASFTDQLWEDCKETCRNGACIVASCIDNDADGYGAQISAQCSKQGIDCNDNNAAINPGALEICGNGIDENCVNGDNLCGETCTDAIKNQDETDVDCGGVCVSQGKKCVNTKSCKIGSDCQSNYCNPSTLKCENAPACSNECTQGATRCSLANANVKQTCGNYDTDTCLEWGGDLTCQYGCSNNQCNTAPPQGADLTITLLAVQYPTTPIAGQDITMAFNIKNQGTQRADWIFWKLDTGSPDSDPVNSLGLSLDAGKSITVFTKIKYATRGTYIAKVIVDYQNTIVEINEGNNELTRSIIVS